MNHALSTIWIITSAVMAGFGGLLFMAGPAEKTGRTMFLIAAAMNVSGVWIIR